MSRKRLEYDYDRSRNRLGIAAGSPHRDGVGRIEHHLGGHAEYLANGVLVVAVFSTTDADQQREPGEMVALRRPTSLVVALSPPRPNMAGGGIDRGLELRRGPLIQRTWPHRQPVRPGRSQQHPAIRCPARRVERVGSAVDRAPCDTQRVFWTDLAVPEMVDTDPAWTGIRGRPEGAGLGLDRPRHALAIRMVGRNHEGPRCRGPLG